MFERKGAALIRFVVLFLCFSRIIYADVKVYKNQDIFYTDNYSIEEIFYYISLKDNNIGDAFPKNHVYLKDTFNLKNTERVMSFRARFFVNAKLNLDPKIFNDAKTFNTLNRKTKFEKISDGLFKAKRPSFLFDIEFKNSVTISTNKLTNEHSKFIKSLSGLKFPLKLIVSQDMFSYNRFISRTNYHFAIYEVEKEKYVIDVIGRTGFRKEIPDFVQEKMVKDYSEKMLHFKKSLMKVLSI